jgi:sulfate adenylyltransferase (ADP) / ATP adenylyltransferase
MTEQRLRPGTLWPLLQQRRREALASGTLQTIATTWQFVEDGGVRFVIRMAADPARQDADPARQSERCHSGGPPPNPFLPCEPDLCVAGISETHLALLNKFNAIDHHLLIVTRHFTHQETLLDSADFQALSLCLAEYEGLGFYNGGAVAGASQPHKHLQLVPLPLIDASGPAIPIDPLLRTLPRDAQVGTVPGFSFPHAFVALDAALVTQPRVFANALHEGYRAGLQTTGIKAVRVDGATRQSAPYNLLVTRDWLLVIPRRRAEFAGISINSLGFAGSLFVKNQEQLAVLRRWGPLAVLRAVAQPTTPAA